MGTKYLLSELFLSVSAVHYIVSEGETETSAPKTERRIGTISGSLLRWEDAISSGEYSTLNERGSWAVRLPPNNGS